MKINAKIINVKTGRDSGGQTYTEFKVKFYHFPIQGKVDPEAQHAALFLTAIPYHTNEKQLIEIEIADPELEPEK
jgi:hypothetical protein